MIEKLEVFTSNSAVPPVYRMREDYDKDFKFLSACN